MKKSSYRTLFIMSPACGKRIFQLSFHVFWWRLSFLVCGLFLFSAFSGIWSVIHRHRLSAQTDYLARENQRAKTELENKNQEIIFLLSQLESIQKQAQFIRDYLGLSPGKKAEGNVGQGGGEFFESDPDDSSENQESDMAISSLSFINPTVSRLDSDLEEIIQSMMKQKEDLDHMPTISPVDQDKAWISCGFGWRSSPFTGKKQFHPAIDLAGWKGTPIYAPAKGTVIFERNNGSMGLTIRIKHNKIYTTSYGHLLKTVVKKGQSVNRGDVIGHMGNTGRSTGYHLHYEISENGKRIDPFPLMMDWKESTFAHASEE